MPHQGAWISRPRLKRLRRVLRGGANQLPLPIFGSTEAFVIFFTGRLPSELKPRVMDEICLIQTIWQGGARSMDALSEFCGTGHMQYKISVLSRQFATPWWPREDVAASLRLKILQAIWAYAYRPGASLLAFFDSVLPRHCIGEQRKLARRKYWLDNAASIESHAAVTRPAAGTATEFCDAETRSRLSGLSDAARAVAAEIMNGETIPEIVKGALGLTKAEVASAVDEIREAFSDGI